MIFDKSLEFYVELFTFKDKNSGREPFQLINELLKTEHISLNDKKESDRIIFYFRRFINAINYYAKEFIEGVYVTGNRHEKERLSKILNRYLEHNEYNLIFYYSGVKYYIMKK